MRDVVTQIEAPRAAHVLEREIAAIPECDVGQRERRILEQHVSPVDLAELIAQPILRIAVHDVAHVASADQDVFPPVEIDVEKQRGPRPS